MDYFIFLPTSFSFFSFFGGVSSSLAAPVFLHCSAYYPHAIGLGAK
jgi:hypothetical protein